MGGRRFPLAVLPYALRDTGYIREAAPAAFERQRQLRSSYSVHFYSGKNGTGKSLWMIHDTLPDLDSGRTVLSTVRLLDYQDPRPCEGWERASVTDQVERQDCTVCLLEDPPGHQQAHPGYVPFSGWPQLLALRNGICLMDEITGVADSSDSEGLPNMVRNEFAQMRRAKVVLRISGLNFIRASKRLREACVGVTRCESFLPYDVYDDEGRLELWRPRRLSVARTYAANTLPIDDIKDSHWEEADLMVKSRAWIPTMTAIHAYDTNAPVSRVGQVSDAGVCAHCTGTRRRQECICDDYQAEVARRSAGRRSGRAQRGAPPTLPTSLPLAVGQ